MSRAIMPSFFNPLNEQAQLLSSQKQWNAATCAKDVLLAAKNDLETAYKDCPPSQCDGAIVLNFAEWAFWNMLIIPNSFNFYLGFSIV